VYLCSKDAIESNPPVNFAKEARRFFPNEPFRTWRSEYESYMRNGQDFSSLERSQGDQIMSAYAVGRDDGKANTASRSIQMTFAQFAYRLGIYKGNKTEIRKVDPTFMHDAVLIIDEAHKLFKPLAGQRTENDAVRQWLLARDSATMRTQGDIKVVLLTATPGETPSQMVTLLGAISDRRKAPLQEPDMSDEQCRIQFQASIRGLVSYLDLSEDQSRFPKLKREDVRVEMGAEHALSYAKQFCEFIKTVHDLWVGRVGEGAGATRRPDVDVRVLELFAKLMVNTSEGQAQDAGNEARNGDDRRRHHAYDFGTENKTAADTPHCRNVKHSGRWFTVSEPDVKKAVHAYRELRLRSSWCAMKDIGGGQRPPPTAEQLLTAPPSATHVFCAKAVELCKRLVEHGREKHYIYSEFDVERRAGKWTPGAWAIAIELEKRGYRKVSVAQAGDICDALHVSLPKKKTVSFSQDRTGPEHARHTEVKDEVEARKIIEKVMGAQDGTFRGCYIFLSASDLSKSDGGAATSGAKVLTTLYNCSANSRGQVVQVCLATSEYNESIDLLAVRHLHFFEPLKSSVAEQQAIGRARRNCSHHQLPTNQWDVTMHRYYSVLPKGTSLPHLFRQKGVATKAQLQASADMPSIHTGVDKTIDHIVERAADEVRHTTDRFFDLVKTRAVDCQLFQEFHRLPLPCMGSRRTQATPEDVVLNVDATEAHAHGNKENKNHDKAPHAAGNHAHGGNAHANHAHKNHARKNHADSHNAHEHHAHGHDGQEHQTPGKGQGQGLEVASLDRHGKMADLTRRLKHVINHTQERDKVHGLGKLEDKLREVMMESENTKTLPKEQNGKSRTPRHEKKKLTRLRTQATPEGVVQNVGAPDAHVHGNDAHKKHAHENHAHGNHAHSHNAHMHHTHGHDGQEHQTPGLGQGQGLDVASLDRNEMADLTRRLKHVINHTQQRDKVHGLGKLEDKLREVMMESENTKTLPKERHGKRQTPRHKKKELTRQENLLRPVMTTAIRNSRHNRSAKRVHPLAERLKEALS
jgi:hypothetical protein